MQISMISLIFIACSLMATTSHCLDFDADSGEFNSFGSSGGLDTDFDSNSGDSPSSFDVDLQSDESEPMSGDFGSEILSGHKGWKKHGGHGGHGGHKGWKKHGGHGGGHKGWKKHGGHGGHKGWKKHGGHGGHKGWKKHGHGGGHGHKGWKKW